MRLCIMHELKQFKLKNHHKRQEVKYAIFIDIECYMIAVRETIGDNTQKICEHCYWIKF